MARWAFAEHASKGPINLGHRLGHVKGDPQVFRAIVYDKGAYVLHMLRGIVGDEAFRRALVSFQETHRFGKAGTDDLREALETASGLDLSAYFRQWVFGTALPRLRYTRHSTKAGTEEKTDIDVRGENLPGPAAPRAGGRPRDGAIDGAGDPAGRGRPVHRHDTDGRRGRSRSTPTGDCSPSWAPRPSGRAPGCRGRTTRYCRKLDRRPSS